MKPLPLRTKSSRFLFCASVKRRLPLVIIITPSNAGEIFGREEREVVFFRIELVALDGGDVESAGLAEFGHRLFGGPKARVFVEARVGQKEEFLGRLRETGAEPECRVHDKNGRMRISVSNRVLGNGLALVAGVAGDLAEHRFVCLGFVVREKLLC